MRHHSGSLLSRLVNRPLLATPEMARYYLGYLTRREGITGALIEGRASTPLGQLTAVGHYSYRSGQSFAQVPGTGIAVIEVMGSLTHKLGSIYPESGMTGYDGIERQVSDAVNDPNVRGIVLDIHSHGGEVAGCFDLADKIHVFRAVKPIWAIADEAAYSAAYCLASQAHRVVMPRTGGVGSVGVVVMHADYSGALEREGVAVTLIHAGAHKVDGNPFQPLPPGVRDELQDEVNSAYNIFTETVARGRKLSQKAVIGTEARCFTADDALRAGFIDAVQPSSQTFAEFAEHLKTGRAAAPTGPSPAATVTGPGPKASAEEIRAYAKAQWDSTPSLHREFGRFEAFAAYTDAELKGKANVHGRGAVVR
ncbi:MAG: S49 family peptidase [Rhodospirillaceae bacterium]